MAQLSFPKQYGKMGIFPTAHKKRNGRHDQKCRYLDYVLAGSSGRTASGVATSFALVELGTDTGNSVCGSSSHLSLVGMRSTHGILSLDGIVPLVLSADVFGPMTCSIANNRTMYRFMQNSWVQYPLVFDESSLMGKELA